MMNRFVRGVGLSLPFFLVIGSSSEPPARAETSSTVPAPPVRAGVIADTLRFTLLSVKDPQTGGGEAFTMLVPLGWHVDGGIVWQPLLANLAAVSMRVWNPDGPEMLEIFPNIPFVWRNGGIFGFPAGSNYLGMYVQQPIGDAASYLQQVVLPQFRGGVSARIVAVEELPEVASAVSEDIQEPGAIKQVRAERVRVEYLEGKRPMVEDFYCVLVYTQSPMAPGVTQWGAERIYSFRAAKGQLDARASLLHSMASSVRINPVWFAKYLQVVQMLQQNQMAAIRSAGELSRYMARTSDEISEMQRQAWERRQASDDRMATRFSEYIRGVETYQDPVLGGDVQLPSGYDNAWVSGNGEYLLSNDALLDPNVGSMETWHILTPRSR